MIFTAFTVWPFSPFTVTGTENEVEAHEHSRPAVIKERRILTLIEFLFHLFERFQGAFENHQQL